MENQKPNFTASAESQAITKLLSTKDVGATVTYDEMLAVTGETQLLKIRGNIRTARQALQRDRQIVFEVITGIGIRRSDDKGILGISKQKMDHVRRGAKRAAQTLACVELDKLAPEMKTDALCMQAQLGAMTLAASLSSRNKIEQKIVQGHQLNVGNVLGLFSITEKNNQ